MIIRSIVDRALFRGERVTEEERAQLLDWFARAENIPTVTNPLTGQISLQYAGPTQYEIGIMVEEALKSRQVVNRLSDISNQFGVITAGEFRTGNGKVPGDGFTGGRFGWPGFTYNSADWFIAGVENDTLKTGLSISNGRLYAENATISGTLTATAGVIGDWTITADTIQALSLVGSDVIGIRMISTLARIDAGNTSGTYIQIDGANQRIRSSNFVTGQAGFQIWADTGDAEFNNLTARGELKTFLLTASNQMAVGGNIMVTKDAGKLAAAVTAGATTIDFGKAMTTSDWVKIQGPDSTGTASLEWILVGTLVSGTTYNVTRNVDGSGANAWNDDTPFAVIGQSGTGRVEITAGASASVKLITQGAAWNTTTTQAEMSTTSGAVIAGAGNVILDSSGVKIQNSATSWFNFEDSAGGYGNINIAADPNNDFEFTNITTNGTISFFMKNDSGATTQVLHMKQHTSNANEFEVLFERGTSTGGRVSFGGDHFIDYLGTDGTGSATVYFNERNKNIDFNIQGDTIDDLFYADASTDRIGIGTNAPEVRLDVRDGTMRSRLIAALADDTATSFTPNTTVGGMIVMAATGAGNGGFAGYNTVTGTATAMMSGTNFAAANGTLSGTTGTDTKLTVSAHTDGKIYVENRTGASRNILILLM